MGKTPTPPPKVTLWSGHDVNLTIPTEYHGMGNQYQLARPTLGDLRTFLRNATEAGYDDQTPMTVALGGIKVRRGDQP